jgi:thioesterase domain-containing protein
MYQFKDHSSSVAIASQALFSCVSRKAKRIFIPLNEVHDDIEREPIFFVHSISGAAGTDFFDLAARIGSGHKFYGVQAPRGHFKDPTFGGSIESIAELYAEALDAFYPRGDIYLGGWSVGSVIALEMAQRLIEHGRKVALLFVIDLAPENVPGAPPPWDPRYLAELVANVPKALAYRLLVERTLFSQLPTCLPKMAHRLAWRMRPSPCAAASEADAPAPAHPVRELTGFRLFSREQQAFMARLYDAAIAYRARPYAGRVIVYHASITPLFKNPQVARKWRAIAADAEIVRVYGTHSSIVKEPFVIGVTEDLNRRLSALG